MKRLAQRPLVLQKPRSLGIPGPAEASVGVTPRLRSPPGAAGVASSLKAKNEMHRCPGLGARQTPFRSQLHLFVLGRSWASTQTLSALFSLSVTDRDDNAPPNFYRTVHEPSEKVLREHIVQSCVTLQGRAK